MPEPLSTNPWIDVLSIRTQNCLREASILSLEDLRSKTSQDLLALPAFGTGCLEEVEWFLKLQDLPNDENAGGEALPMTEPLASNPFLVMLSGRTRNRLYGVGIFSLADLIEWDAASLLEIKGFGMGGLREVDAFLEANGLLPASAADEAPKPAKTRRRLYRALPEGTRAVLEESGMRVDETLRNTELEDLLAIPGVNNHIVDDLVAAGLIPRPRRLQDLLLVLSASETARAALDDPGEAYVDGFLSSLEQCHGKVDRQIALGVLHAKASMDHRSVQACNERLLPPARTLPTLLFNLQYLPSLEAVGAVDKLNSALDVSTLDDELALLLNLLDERDVAVLRGRFAVDKRPTTLDELGTRFGVTREWIRQVEKRVSEDLRKAYYWDAPLLRIRTAFLLVNEQEIGSIDDAWSMLSERGLTDSAEAIRDFFAVWRAVAPAESAISSSLQAWRAIEHRSYAFPQDIVTAAATGLTRKQQEMSAEARGIANRRLRVVGVVDLEESAGELEAHEASVADVAAVLLSIGLRELAPGYWGTTQKKYAFHRVAERMIKMCGPLPVAAIAIGFFRHQQRQDKPSTSLFALHAGLDGHEAFYLDAQGLVHLHNLGGEGAMPTAAEAAFFRAVHLHGPVVHSSTVYRALAEDGVNPGSMTYLAKYSEVVQPLGESLYCLQGARYDDAHLAAGRAQASSAWVKRYTSTGASLEDSEEYTGNGGTGRRLLSAKEFALSLEPPRAKETIIRLCQQGRIEGATKNATGEWRIPEGTILESGRRTRHRANPQSGETKHERARLPKAQRQASTQQTQGLSPEQYAQVHGVSRERVQYLLRRNLIKGAVFEASGWKIPPDAPFPSRRA